MSPDFKKAPAPNGAGAFFYTNRFSRYFGYRHLTDESICSEKSPIGRFLEESPEESKEMDVWEKASLEKDHQNKWVSS